MGFVITGQVGEKIVYRGGVQTATRDNWIKVRLEPGNYTIFVSQNILIFRPKDIQRVQKEFVQSDSVLSGQEQFHLLRLTKTKFWRASKSFFQRLSLTKLLTSMKNGLIFQTTHPTLFINLSPSASQVLLMVTDSRSTKINLPEQLWFNSREQSKVERSVSQIRLIIFLVYPVYVKGESFDLVFKVDPGFTQVIFWEVDDDVEIDYRENARIC